MDPHLPLDPGLLGVQFAYLSASEPDAESGEQGTAWGLRSGCGMSERTGLPQAAVAASSVLTSCERAWRRDVPTSRRGRAPPRKKGNQEAGLASPRLSESPTGRTPARRGERRIAQAPPMSAALGLTSDRSLATLRVSMSSDQVLFQPSEGEAEQSPASARSFLLWASRET